MSRERNIEMRVYPKGYDKWDDIEPPVTDKRQSEYESKMQDRYDFDEQVKDAEESTFEDDLSEMTYAEMVALLRLYYSPLKYKGCIFPINGEKPFTLDSMKTKAEHNLEVVGHGVYKSYERRVDEYYWNGRYKRRADGSKEKVRKARPFNLNFSLKNHVSMGNNLGIYFNATECKMIAFDLDSETDATDEDTRQSARYLLLVLHGLGLQAFMYFSGRRGYHIEVFFDDYIPVKKLNTLNQIIMNLHHNKGGRHMDEVYPSRKAHRIFGCYHYKTGKFTQAFTIEYSDDFSIVSGKSLNRNESWVLFSKTPFNDSALVDKIIADNSTFAVPLPKTKKLIHNNEYAPSTHFYGISILRRIHETGLYAPYTRYNTSFHLGRYFKHRLQLNEDEARAEIKTWLKRHFSEQCTHYSSLTPFEGAYLGVIKSPYVICKQETINNCLNGYRDGRPFRRERVEIDYWSAVSYLKSLKYPRRKHSALVSLLEKATQLKSLNIGFSYEQLLSIFGVSSKSTVSSWLKLFDKDYIFICTRKGDYKSRKTSQYRLILPKYCYDVIDDLQKPDN